MATPQPYRFVHGGTLPEIPGGAPTIRLQPTPGPPTKEATTWTVRTKNASHRAAQCEAPILLALYGDGESAPADPSEAVAVPARQVALAALRGAPVSGTGALELSAVSGAAGAPFRRGAVDEFAVQVRLPPPLCSRCQGPTLACF